MKAIDVIELFQNSIFLKNTTRFSTFSLVSVAKKITDDEDAKSIRRASNTLWSSADIHHPA